MEHEDPIARLEHTHRRIEERLDDLARGVEEHDLQAIQDVLGFFGRAAARHHEDEELSLFPRLQGRPELEEVLAALAEEHREHERERQALAAIADAIRGPISNDDERALDGVARSFSQLYRRHIAREESDLFPAARRALDDATMATLAEEMAARRPRRNR